MKSFKDIENPAESLISKAETPKQKKNKRVNLAFRADVKEGIEKLAYMNRTSINNLINEILAEYIETHREEINKYDEIFKK